MARPRKKAAPTKGPVKKPSPAGKPPSKEEALTTVKQITDLVFKVSSDAKEREKFLANPKSYLAKAKLNQKAKDILGSLNEKLIMGQIYEMRPDLKPIPVVYTYTSVDVIDSIIVSPISFIAVFLSR